MRFGFTQKILRIILHVLALEHVNGFLDNGFQFLDVSFGELGGVIFHIHFVAGLDGMQGFKRKLSGVQSNPNEAEHMTSLAEMAY